MSCAPGPPSTRSPPTPPRTTSPSPGPPETLPSPGPSSTKSPSPGPPVSVSLPLSPKTLSLPPPPFSWSVPVSPWIESLPGPPSIRSRPLNPVIVSFPPPPQMRSLPPLPSMTLLPPPATITSPALVPTIRWALLVIVAWRPRQLLAPWAWVPIRSAASSDPASTKPASSSLTRCPRPAPGCIAPENTRPSRNAKRRSYLRLLVLDVVAGTAVEPVRAAAADQPVRSAHPEQDVVPGPSEERVLAVVAGQLIRSGGALEFLDRSVDVARRAPAAGPGHGAPDRRADAGVEA